MLIDICVDMLAGVFIDTTSISKVLAQKQPSSYWGIPLFMETPTCLSQPGFYVNQADLNEELEALALQVQLMVQSDFIGHRFTL